MSESSDTDVLFGPEPGDWDEDKRHADEADNQPFSPPFADRHGNPIPYAEYEAAREKWHRSKATRRRADESAGEPRGKPRGKPVGEPRGERKPAKKRLREPSQAAARAPVVGHIRAAFLRRQEARKRARKKARQQENTVGGAAQRGQENSAFVGLRF